MKNGCCLNCTERKIGCHATCEKYLEYAQSRKDLSKARFEHAMKQRGSERYTRCTINKIRRKKR